MPEYRKGSDCSDDIVVSLSIKLTTSERRLVAFGCGYNDGRDAVISVASLNVTAARDMLAVRRLSLSACYFCSVTNAARLLLDVAGVTLVGTLIHLVVFNWKALPSCLLT